ncbi:glycoside hydrolase family 16 protein [Jiulongibacter sediminis]|jgi:beta-glucanase (GH16 family)|uniref:glycoside hydrolase family 16 protein n=1 Tax=Jiulongibacter sediminis TaxID=1605367 RepID=UPI0026F2F9D9|nr:glycoside hydrolase family 16 protein [Jiulongibacter sediminis]
MKYIHIKRIIYSSLSLILCFSLAGFSQNPQKNISEYTFSEKTKWADEFNTSGLPDRNIWGYDLGGGGWGNNELQTYTDNLQNARVEDGFLIIEVLKNETKPTYTSARLVTKNKRDFLYGRIEVKAKLPEGRGTWPAIWTLATENNYGNNYWPDNGELDIMEHVGYDQNRVHSNIHTKAFNHVIGTNRGNNRIVDKASDDFHLYRMDWHPDLIQFYIDDQMHFEFKKEAKFGWAEWPFDKPQYLLLNIAVGGNWGGQKGVDENIFPQKMEIDYVRYYDLKEPKP